jgi:hypothetical protein
MLSRHSLSINQQKKQRKFEAVSSALEKAGYSLQWLNGDRQNVDFIAI